MSERRIRLVGWTVVGVCAGLLVATAVLVVLGLGQSTPGDTEGNGGAGAITNSLAGVSFATVGGLLISRVRGNAIGWIFCVAGLSLTLSYFGIQYADYGLFVASPPWPGVRGLVLLEDVVGPPTFGLVAVALLLFPDGRLPSARWRPALWLSGIGMGLVMTGYMLRAGGGDTPFESVTNPLGIPGARELMDALTGLGWLAMALSVALASVSMVRRLRRSTGVERQQLKWIALAAAALGVGIVCIVATYFLGIEGVAKIREALLGLTLATFPVAAGIAILRYRLYDIDVVINRALVYGALTATLAAAYLGSVLLLQLLLDPVTSGSSLAVAVSTLAVAALFRPARARIQAVVDRRFYRRRYDAQLTLESFSARLREQVDLEALGGELRGVVADTMQPAHVSLWLRGVER